MYQDVIIAGFGGQGVMLIGDLLANAAMESGYNVTYMPVYGVEMRGGTANCTVVVSDDEIGSPIIHSPMSLIAMNRPSVDKFQPRLRDGGVLIANASIVAEELLHSGRCRAYPVPLNALADELGNAKMANVVALGAWLQATGLLPLKEVADLLARTFAQKSEKLAELNRQALLKGAESLRRAAEKDPSLQAAG